MKLQLAPLFALALSAITASAQQDYCGGAKLTKFKYFGVNEAGAEFGQGTIPGLKGTHYTWPDASTYDFFLQKGFNTFRIAFLMDRLTPVATGMTGPFAANYLSDLKASVKAVTSKGGYAVLDPHNFARYPFDKTIITDLNAFKTWWTNVAKEFKDDPNVIFDINNEPWGITATEAANLQQAGIDGIRAAGAKQLILVSGTSWTGAWTWISTGNADAQLKVKDPLNNIAYQMHQYLDSDGSGTSDKCVSATIGAERVRAATEWCVKNKVKCFLGELGAGSNDVCIAAVRSAFCEMQKAGGAWIGALWWAAGPWWGDYFQSIEPPNGAAIKRILPEALIPFV